MKIVKDLLKETYRQLFGVDIGVLKKRRGKIIVTRRAIQKMAIYRIDNQTLENAFGFGIEYSKGKLIQRYPRFSIGLYYKENESQKIDRQGEKSYVVTTCWKGR